MWWSVLNKNLNNDILLPKVSGSSNIPDKNSKIERNSTTLKNWIKKLEGKPTSLKNGRKFYYSQKLCFDKFFEWKEYNFLSGFLTNTILNFCQEWIFLSRELIKCVSLNFLFLKNCIHKLSICVVFFPHELIRCDFSNFLFVKSCSRKLSMYGVSFVHGPCQSVFSRMLDEKRRNHKLNTKHQTIGLWLVS